MREIKFRFWSPKSKLMKTVFYISSTFGVVYELSLEARKDAILMQYTNIKDKNGKEIYEGDLFKPDSLVIPNCLEVKFDKSSASFEPFGNSEYAYVSNLGEVIGNIYENPELLK